MIGKVIGNYKIVSELGAGSMGTVYKALDPFLKREVAIKVLQEDSLSQKDAKKRFLREAEAASKLDHSNISTIYHIEADAEGQIYIIMALYKGEVLRKKLQKGPLEIAKAINYAVQIAEGLQCAHKAAIIHRDIKPENIFITQEDQIKILDFGVAKIMGRDSFSKTIGFIGTLHYASPEQLQSKELNIKTDIWAWGIVLFEMLTGHLPFGELTGVEIIFAIMEKELSKLNEYLASNQNIYLLQEVLDKALAKSASDRFESLQEAIVNLNKIDLSPN